jgi:hypothetical protein
MKLPFLLRSSSCFNSESTEESNLELEDSLPDSSLAGSREADLNSLLAAILLNIKINYKKC